MPPPPLRLVLCLVLLPVCVRAQGSRAVAPDSMRVVERGAQLRVWTGRTEASALVGRLESADSLVVKIVVSGEAGDPRIRFAQLGVDAAGDALGDSAIAAIPWRLVRTIEVASGRRSRRLANTVYGALIGIAIGGGAGSVYGAMQSRSTCAASGTRSCGITPAAGEGMAIGAVLGAIAGGVYGGVRESFATIWTTLPDRGRQLRGGPGRAR